MLTARFAFSNRFVSFVLRTVAVFKFFVVSTFSFIVETECYQSCCYKAIQVEVYEIYEYFSTIK